MWLELSWPIVGYKISLESLLRPTAVLAFHFYICLWVWTALRSVPFLEGFLYKKAEMRCQERLYLKGLAMLLINLLAVFTYTADRFSFFKFLQSVDSFLARTMFCTHMRNSVISAKKQDYFRVKDTSRNLKASCLF